MKSEYGLSREQYDGMISEQAGKCLLCKLPPGRDGKKSLSVDHCHKTGKVRGLLCGMCNTAIGKLNDDPALLRAAAEYLERYVST